MIDGPLNERSYRTADEAEEEDSQKGEAEELKKPEKGRTGRWGLLFYLGWMFSASMECISEEDSVAVGSLSAGSGFALMEDISGGFS